MPHSSARIGDISCISRNEVKMNMKDRLPGSFSAIHADVVSIGR